MGNVGREKKMGRNCHRLERRGGMSGLVNEDLWVERVRFHNHAGTETLVCFGGINAPQQPTVVASGITGLSVRSGGGGGAVSWRYQRLLSTTEVPTGGRP